MAAIIGINVKPKAGGGYTCKVPLSAVEQDGVPPEQGDKVDYSVSGTVQSVSGNDATVDIESINGEPVGEEAAESPEEEAAEPETGTESTAAMGSRLKKGAAGQKLPF
jgi:hypothetical protein